MSALCQTSSKSISDRESFVHLTIRAWLNSLVPSTISELNAATKNLGRPAKNLIARIGGIKEFLKKQCPELSVTDERVEICLSQPEEFLTGKLDLSELVSNLNQLSKDDVSILNRKLSKLQIEAKSGLLVSVLHKRDHLSELQRQCDARRSEIASLKSRIAELRCEVSDEQVENLTKLRDTLLQRLAEKQAVLELKSRKEKLESKLDCDIESKEDKLERLKLKAIYAREKLAMFDQDLFFESYQNESLTREYLTQHSTDTQKLMTVLEVLVIEKCSHSQAVLKAHIQAMEDEFQKETSASRKCRQEIGRIENEKVELLGRIRNRQVDLQTISKVKLITMDSVKSSLFRKPTRELRAVENSLSHHQPADNGNSEESVNCAICLHDLESQPKECLDCSHSFHSSCLAEMYSSGATHCPLCRRYEPSADDFPTLL